MNETKELFFCGMSSAAVEGPPAHKPQQRKKKKTTQSNFYLASLGQEKWMSLVFIEGRKKKE